MTEKASGLRFDIYERIHLPEHMTGIERLDEIELTPHMELQLDSDHAVLKGHLQLSGTYVGTENAHERQELSHRIPVEISMPEERLVRDAELGVDIENFDVDLLSARTVNVTGVLSLKGIESVSTVGRPNWQDENEMVFVQPPPLYPAEEETRTTAEIPGSGEQAMLPTLSDGEDKAKVSEVSQVEAVEQVSREVRDSSQTKEELAQANDNAAQAAEASSQAEEDSSRDLDEEASSRDENVLAQEEDSSRDQQESQNLIELADEGPPGVKVAFASQPVEDKSQTVQEQAPLRDDENAADDQENEESEGEDEARQEEPAKAIDAEWKNLFLGQEETQQFRKVRMCIVQKEETLESIAERYELNPREIILYNRMTDQQTIEEGQVLYIPR